MNLFLAEALNEAGGHLGKDESHHANRVLRIQPGDAILVTNGQGIIYEAEVTDSSKSELNFKNIGVYKEQTRNGYTHIAIAPTKSNDRFELFLEKATELGVDEITPVICDHSERKVYKAERGEKIINAACKQSLRCWWPVLNEPVKFNDFIKSEFTDDNRFIAYCGRGGKTELLSTLPTISEALVLIGPEGDFSEREIKLATDKNFLIASLGDQRLRTETAGIAVAMAHSLLRSIQ